MLKEIIDSSKKALRGEEKLWKVFWLWGVLFYVFAISTGIVAFVLKGETRHHLIDTIAIFIGILGLIFTFIYPIVFSVSLWKCSPNTTKQVFNHTAKIFIPAFFIIHFFIGRLVFLGSVSLIIFY